MSCKGRISCLYSVVASVLDSQHTGAEFDSQCPVGQLLLSIKAKK